jgi:oligoendopeptidase F
VYDFQRAIPAMLFALGFSAEKAAFISEKIVVDAARGAGHALAPGMRKDTAHLRTRVSAQGMNYKGYNVAMHELGHCVEQIFSMHATPNYLLTSVPNTAFTECFAFIFQRRDLENLGLQEADHRDRHLFALKTVWETYEICGVALVDMRVWRYLYAHPDIDATALKEAVIRIAKDVWDTYYASVFGISDSAILAIYSHMIDAGMYLPDYPLGHLIAFQLEKYLEGKNLGTEIERMCSVGYVTPQHWMKNAVGTDISTEPLLQAAEEAVRFVTD